MKTEFDLEQSLDDIEQATRQQGESLRDIQTTAATIHQVFDEEKAHAMRRMAELYFELLTQEIDRDDLESLGYKGLESRGVGLGFVSGLFKYRDVRVLVEIDRQRMGEFWLIALHSESVRRCDKGELMETLLQTFAQIRFNEKAAIAGQTIE